MFASDWGPLRFGNEAGGPTPVALPARTRRSAEAPGARDVQGLPSRGAPPVSGIDEDRVKMVTRGEGARGTTGKVSISDERELRVLLFGIVGVMASRSARARKTEAGLIRTQGVSSTYHLRSLPSETSGFNPVGRT